MLAPVDWANCKLFVEYGPGVGTFTEHVLRRMAPDSTLITIDTNEDFTRYLGRKFADSRLRPITGSAADVREIIADCGFPHADYILSGLPFSTLPAGLGPRIAAETHAALRPGGAFLVYIRAKVRDFMAPLCPYRQGLRMVYSPTATVCAVRTECPVAPLLRRPRRGG